MIAFSAISQFFKLPMYFSGLSGSRKETCVEKFLKPKDLKTYNTLAASNRDSETDYDYEERINEDKKNLKILDRRYLNQLVKEVKSVLA